MRIIPAGALIALTCAGCVTGNPDSGGDDGGGEIVTDGGTLMLEECGYEVATRFGASAPALSEAIVGDDPTPRHVHLGFGGDPATSMAVQWRTADEATRSTVVQYGVGGALDRTLEGFNFVYYSGFNQSGELIRIHEAHICGLVPDTEYSYRVGSIDADGNEVFSTTYTFRTAPAAGADSEIVIANLGDSRDGYNVLGQMIDRVVEYQPDLVLFSGDAVTVGAVQLEWETFFETAEPLFATAPVISAHGNHDVNAVNFYSQHAMPGDEENFGFRYGPVHTVVLNDTPIDAGDIQGKSASVLDAELTANADAPWSFVMHHKPIYSASTRHGSDQTLRDTWGPIIDEHEVDLVLAGHDHDYERSKPMRNNLPQASVNAGTTYIVSGGAGASLYGSGADFWTELSEKTHSFLIIRVRPTMLEMQAFREDGSLIDSLTIAR